VSRLLGHATIALACKVYGRWLRPNTNDTVALLDSIVPVGPRLKAVGRPSGSKAVASAV